MRRREGRRGSADVPIRRKSVVDTKYRHDTKDAGVDTKGAGVDTKDAGFDTKDAGEASEASEKEFLLPLLAVSNQDDYAAACAALYLA